MAGGQNAAARAIAAGQLEREDVDADILAFLGSVSEELADSCIQDFVAADLSSVKNRPGYLLGMLRQRVRKSKRGASRKESPDDRQKKLQKSAGVEGEKPTQKAKASVGVQHTLFVNQVPYTCSPGDIAAHFCDAAGVTAETLEPHVRVLIKDGAFNGTAFVDMPSIESMEAGLALHRSELAGRQINVRSALTREQLANLPSPGAKADSNRQAATASDVERPKNTHVTFQDEEDEAEEQSSKRRQFGTASSKGRGKDGRNAGRASGKGAGASDASPRVKKPRWRNLPGGRPAHRA